MIFSAGTLEYMFTAGLSVSFIAFFFALYSARREIKAAMKEAGLTRNLLIAIVIVAILFVGLEIALVKPTQQLFFDDVIYQAGAQQMLRTGQAWMCDYGTPLGCTIGEIYHEPIGTSFNLALGFAAFGISQATAYGVILLLAFIGAIFVGIVAMMLLHDKKAAIFAMILFSLSPIVLTWAFPTTSDIPTMTYALIAVFCMLVMLKKRNTATLALAAFSLAVLAYMKVYAALYVIIIPVMYVLMDGSGIRDSIVKNLKAVKSSLDNTNVLIVLLLFLVLVTPEVFYVTSNLSQSYGYQGTNVGLTCSPGYIPATSKFSLTIFMANVCGNSEYWFNGMKWAQLVYPFSFGVMAVIGGIAMAVKKRRTFLALLLWFMAIWLLYTAFYAGGVNYGVDVRFMLGAVAQVSIFGGYGISMLSNPFDKEKARHTISKMHQIWSKLSPAIMAVALIVIIYSFYLTIPIVGINPSKIGQAADARLYQNFIYNQSKVIPNSCLVFSYDPTLFNLVGKPSAQFAYLFVPSFLQSASSQYNCGVIDYGYWCTTPGNICQNVTQQFNTTILASIPGKYNDHFTLYEFNLSKAAGN